MAARSPIPRLQDIIDACELIQSEMAGVTLDAFEADKRKRWVVERGTEIIAGDVEARAGGFVGIGEGLS
jgi:uncharacterized protein with HEPN domain